jgi:hypothetical protein
VHYVVAMLGWVDDTAFDAQLPPALPQSLVHSTELSVARRAAKLLAPSPGTLVLDVGAGAGKFCLAAALAVPHSEFIGVECRPHLVTIANGVAISLGISNARFLAGDALEVDWSRFDAFYLLNPFAEQAAPALALDDTLDLDADRFIASLINVRRKLASARLGTRIVTYHGYGAPLPLGYDRVPHAFVDCYQLERWIKRPRITRQLGPHGELV